MSNEILIIYDGACPFCTEYTRKVRLEKVAGTLVLVDARAEHPVLNEIRAARLDLNEGMVLKMNGRLYHGAECMNRLALLSTRSDTFNRLNWLFFRHTWLARLLYPVLRLGRNITLRVRGVSKIAS